MESESDMDVHPSPRHARRRRGPTRSRSRSRSKSRARSARESTRSLSESSSRSSSREHEVGEGNVVLGTEPVLPPELEEKATRKAVKLPDKLLKQFKALAIGTPVYKRTVKSWVKELPRVDAVVAEAPVLNRKLRPEQSVVAEVYESDMIALHDLMYATLNMAYLSQQEGLDASHRSRFVAHIGKLQSMGIMMVTNMRRQAVTRALGVHHMPRQEIRTLDGKAREAEEHDDPVHYLFPADAEDMIRDEMKEKRRRLVVYYHPVPSKLPKSTEVESDARPKHDRMTAICKIYSNKDRRKIGRF